MSRRIAGALRGVAVVVIAAMALAGCGSGDSGAPAAAAPGGKSKAKAPAASSGRTDMVSAVSAGQGPGAVDVRFAMAARPEVGKPVDIQIALIPNVDLVGLYARFQGAEGLDVVKGGETEHFDHPAKGAEKLHAVTVLPRSDGIFNLTAIVLADSETGSVSRSYSIPIIAGAGLREPPPETPPAKPAARQP